MGREGSDGFKTYGPGGECYNIFSNFEISQKIRPNDINL